MRLLRLRTSSCSGGICSIPQKGSFLLTSGVSEGYFKIHARSSPWTAVNLKPSAQAGEAAVHIIQTVSTRWGIRWIEAMAVIFDAQCKRAVANRETQQDFGRVRVFYNVGESFLCHEVQRMP